jgi:hypothetical protein
MKKLLRKVGLPAIALAVMMALFTPISADAAVRFGVGVGVAPVNPYPYYQLYASPYGYASPHYAN